MNTPTLSYVRMGIKPLSLLATAVLILQGCFLFPSNPGGNPDDSTPFTPSFVWLQPTRGVVMDVFLQGDIISLGDVTVGFERRVGYQQYSSEGVLKFSETPSSGNSLIREVVADYENIGYDTQCTDVPAKSGNNYASAFYTSSSGGRSNAYTRYNTVLSKPDTDPYPWSGYRYVVGPSIAKGPRQGTAYRYWNPSAWMVGSFTDSFSFIGNPCPTYGKADCFVVRINQQSGIPFLTPVRHQWGGPENDLAYDVASDDIGNPTIFLRAGSEFGITSATQSIVKMQRGYNIVTLDTNGLLTKTYPVPLEASGELTDTKIALGKNGVVYILAYDEVRKQYFLTKASPSGVAWTHYLPSGVGNENSGVFGFSARMDLCVDSKDNVYITGCFIGTVDFGGLPQTTTGVEAFVAQYSPSNVCLGALKMGSGMGVTVRLAPDETALYVNGWANGKIMGIDIPDQSDPRNGVLRPGAFLVKLKMTK